MAYSIERLPERISIGRETETGVTDVMIDCGAWVSKWPGMTLHAIHTPEGGAPYILQTETVGSVLVWHVTDADTAKPGTGRMEIVGEMDGRRKVSATVKVSVAARMSGTVGEPPEAAKPWVESVIGAADRITGMKAQAETLDAGSGATAAWDGEQGLLTIGVPKGEQGPKGEKGEKGPQGEKGEPGKDAVVDATLTQSGQAADAKVTGDALALKLTEPSTGLAVGKYFRIAAIDESGHAVLEAVDLPIANDKQAGMVQVSNYDGWYMYGNRLQARTIESANYAGMNNTAIIGKGTLNSILSTPSVMPSLTAEEQAAARKRMCVENGADFELLVDATLEEEANTFQVVIPRPLRECMYQIWFFNNNEEQVTAQIYCFGSSSAAGYLLRNAKVNSGYGYALNGFARHNGQIKGKSLVGYACDSMAPSWTSYNPGNGSACYMSYPSDIVINDIGMIKIRLLNTGCVLNAGAVIKVWGR